MNLITSILALFIVWGVTCSDNKTTLTLNRTVPAKLQPEQSYIYQTILPAEIDSTNDFFFVAQWPSSDPLQYPFIDVTLGDGYHIECYNSNDQFSGVCKIPAERLWPNSTVTATVYCFVECELTLTPLLSKRLRINLNDTATFSAPPTSGLPVEIELYISNSINYTQIAVYAQIDSFDKATEGLEMLASIGDESTPIPSTTSFDESGKSIYWGGKGIFLSKQEIKPGQWLKIYLYISEGMKVKFFSNYIYGNNFLIDLDKSYFDFTSYKESKLYVLDLSNSTKISEKTVTIGFLVYSGNPFISIAMDNTFLHPIHERGAVSTSTYLITESLRKQYNFSGYIYIKVESSWSSDYLLYTGTDSKNYISLFPDVSLYNQLEANDLYNYFFDDLVSSKSNGSTIRSYSIRIDMIRGHTTFGIRRCKSAETSLSLLSCVINETSALADKALLSTFQDINITMKQSDHYYYMSFQYDAAQCHLFNETANYYCSFHIVAVEGANITSDYTITLNKRLYTTTIMEGTLARDFIFKDEYLYYRFMIASLEEVTSITFYATIIEGDIYLMGSIIDQFPTTDSSSETTFFSVGNYLTFNKDALAKTIYVSVYGIELSEFTLVAKVTRNAITHNTTNTTTNGTENTKLTLKLDLSQEFVLQEADTSVVFLLSTPTTMNVTAEIMQLAGIVNLQIRDSSNQTINCTNSTNTNSKITCTFLSKAKVVYSAFVTAKKGDTQKFVILYHQEDVCIIYTLNLPIFLELNSGEKTCIMYSLTKLTELEVTSSVPLSNLLDQTLHMEICLNKNCLTPTLSHHQQISKNELISYCKFGQVNNSNVFESCSIKISFASNTSLGFEVIVEEQGKDVGLFDGIVEKINAYGLTHEKGKYFYYEIYQWSAVKIFFTSLTSSMYYIALHFVEEKTFLTNSSDIYLPYRETNYDLQQKFQKNFYEAYLYGSNTNILTISSSIVDKYCDQCFLTLSIYPFYTDTHSLSYFEIEVSQGETMLVIGQSKIGYLESDEIYNYQLQPSKQSDAMITIKDLSRESSRQQNCFSASLASSDNDYPEKIENGFAYISKGSTLSNLYVQAMSDYCNYEVTYTRMDLPLVIATSNRKYQFNKDAAGEMYLLYTHASSQSFRIIQIINTGNIKIYATPLANQTVRSLLVNLTAFPFTSDQNGAILVSNNSTKFCTNCQYLIVLEAKTAVNSEIVIANYNASISLSVNGIIKEKIIVSELSFRNYTFNSISAFNITVNPIYGKLKIIVIDPSKNIIINANVSNSGVFVVPHNNKTQDFSFDFNSYYTRYAINVECESDCSYTIKASKESLTSRLFEGIPLYYTFNGNETISLQFLNLITPTAGANTLNLLVDIVETKSSTAPRVTVTATHESQEGANPVDLQIASLVQSDSVYNIELPLKVGTYYIKVSIDLNAKTSIILAKENLIHLRPSSNAIMFKEGVYELYSSNRAAMIEIFTCYGEISVDASSTYKDFSTPDKQYGEIILEQNNYGGHFVINADSIFGEYFIKVSNKRRHQPEIGYIITYYHYNRNDVQPYKLIDLVSREITYSLTKTAVTFALEPVTVKWDLSDSIDSVYVQYRVYVADNKIKVGKYANCRLGEVFSVDAVQKQDSVSVSIDISKISEIIGDQSIYFVGAQAIVYIEPAEHTDDDYPEELNLIYQTIELSNVRMPIAPQQSTSSYSAQMIIVWFLLPFAIAGVILYFALKYCIKKYRGLVPNELMEEADHGESEQGVNLPDSSPYSNNPSNNSQSLKDQV